jgi:hypothetical protein
MISIDSSFNNISNSNLTFGITTETLKDIIESYKLSIELLKEKLSHALPLEEKIKLENQLIWAEKELKKKIEEVARLQKTIDDIKPNEKILSKAKEILTTNGVDEAIKYLQSSEARAKKSMVDELMMEQANQFQLEAQLLIVQNRYDEGKKAYKEMLRYDRSHDRLFEVATFLQEQNNFKDAKRYYTEALKLYRDLATKNPDVYNPDIAMILNNLAVLESDENHNKEARAYYTEALDSYIELAKPKPSVYKPFIANTLNNLALLEKDEKHNKEAREYYTEALEIRIELATKNPDVYTPDVATTLNNLANLESDENHNEKARGYYTEALDKYRALAKTNLDVYKPFIANTLNNLAVLESDENHNDKARGYYNEALEKYRDLAKTNPNAFEIDYARTLIIGVYLLREDRGALEEAKKILLKERYKNIYEAQKLLDIANSL